MNTRAADRAFMPTQKENNRLGLSDPRSLPEWIGASPDSPIPPRVRLRLFARFHGRCPKCSRTLRPGRFAYDHIEALCNGGENREGNIWPLCDTPCHSDKTRADVKEKSRTMRKRRANIGLKKPRTITRWRKFDRTPVYASRER